MAKTYTRRTPKLDPNGQRIGLYLEPQDAALLADLQAALGAERGGTVTLNETVREAIRFRAMLREKQRAYDAALADVNALTAQVARSL
jgi:hypothetical protein